MKKLTYCRDCDYLIEDNLSCGHPKNTKELQEDAYSLRTECPSIDDVNRIR
jgi:hypothetical protein